MRIQKTYRRKENTKNNSQNNTDKTCKASAIIGKFDC